jgi:hypothetical protein
MIGEGGVAGREDPPPRLGVSTAPVTWWPEVPDQWAPTSPWHDRRGRPAAHLALDRPARLGVERVGSGRPTGSSRPRALPCALPRAPFPYDPAQAKRLRAEAGDPHGVEAGDLTPLPPFGPMGAAVGPYLGAVGIRTKLRPVARAAFRTAWRERKVRGLILTASGALGHAAPRLATCVISTAPDADGGYPDRDDRCRQPAVAHPPGRRQALRHQRPRLMPQRVMSAPIVEPAVLPGFGPRGEAPGAGLIPLFASCGPAEELRFKRP